LKRLEKSREEEKIKINWLRGNMKRRGERKKEGKDFNEK
jgi:hypothetical protein